VTRREAVRLGLAGGALACFGRGCQPGAKTAVPPPHGEEPVYALAPGDSPYDDFDGHGCFQSYEGLDQATAGSLDKRIWSHNGGSQVVGSGDRGFVLEIASSAQLSSYAWLISQADIEFTEFGSLRADVLLSSRSTAPRPCAGLNFHTTIPEQPPGRSWYVTLGLFKDPAGSGALVIGHYENLNLGLLQNDLLGEVGLDEWHALRLDIVTRDSDPDLGAQDLRLDYYLDGALLASRIPEDSPILIDPDRTGLGPHRSLIVSRNGYEGDAHGCFDNVRARYRDRTG
jgi:hypothetical protein